MGDKIDDSFYEKLYIRNSNFAKEICKTLLDSTPILDCTFMILTDRGEQYHFQPNLDYLMEMIAQGLVQYHDRKLFIIDGLPEKTGIYIGEDIKEYRSKYISLLDESHNGKISHQRTKFSKVGNTVFISSFYCDKNEKVKS